MSTRPLIVFGFLAGVLVASCADDGDSETGGTATTGDGTAATSSATGDTEGASTGATSSDSTSAATSSSAGTTDGATTGGTAGATTTDSGGSSSGAGSTGGAGATWNGFAADFFETYCGECHWEGDAAGRDYSTLAGVMAESVKIRCGVTPTALADCGAGPSPNQVPVGGGPKPSDADRNALVAWIEAGLPEG